MRAREGRNAGRPWVRVADRLFLGGCTLAYAVLIVSVLAALRMVAA